MFVMYEKENMRFPVRVWLKERGSLEKSCMEQAYHLSRLPFLHKWVSLMPDTHAGMGMPIGGVIAAEGVVIPNAVGVDIGCGMETVRIAQREIDSEKLDALIRSAIPCGREVRMASHEYCSSIDLSALRCAPYVNLERAKKSIGTLGGGNHFIEADRSDTGDIYIVADVLGHKDVNTTKKHYAAISEDNRKKVADAVKLRQEPDDTPPGDKN